jgi:hypothetical protein
MSNNGETTHDARTKSMGNTSAPGKQNIDAGVNDTHNGMKHY